MVDWKKLSDEEKIQHLITLGAEIQAAQALLAEFELLMVSWLNKIHARQNQNGKNQSKAK